MRRGLASLSERYDAILLDLDGTVLDGRGELCERTRQAIGHLVGVGMRVLLCTGRSVVGTRPVHQALGLEEPFVSYNGSWIGGPDGIPLVYSPIPDEHVRCVLVLESLATFSFRHAKETKFTVMSQHPEHHRVAGWYAEVVRAESHDHLPAEDLMRVSMFFGLKDCIDTAWEAMSEGARQALHREVFPLNIFPPYAESELVLCEVQRRTRGKAEALAWLEDTYGIPSERTIAVGDHVNDLSMLAAAGLAVCPANAHPSAAALADLRIGHHAEAGLARWIERGAPTNGDLRQGPRARGYEGPAAGTGLGQRGGSGAGADTL